MNWSVLIWAIIITAVIVWILVAYVKNKEISEAEWEARSLSKLYQEQKELNALEKERTQKIQIELEHIKNEHEKETAEYIKKIAFLNQMQSNLTAIPYMAAIMADFETYEIEALAKQLDWGHDVSRQKKVASIRDIRRTAQEMVEKNLEAKYQLEYLLHLFPALEDVIETDSKQLPVIRVEELSEYDRARDWLSKEEYEELGSVERNQLALDRYKTSHNKSKWQIGRDYEYYVGYRYNQKGYEIDYFGSYKGMEDLGRDLIAHKADTTLIIQCKYWGKEKLIHEKHILQLYGTLIAYCIENKTSEQNTKAILVTNIELSEQAKKMAQYLNVEYVEHLAKKDYPCIKCNINVDVYGNQTKIYHLPFDQQYDATKIDHLGEFYAMTVKEAEDAGFRRAYKWFGA